MIVLLLNKVLLILFWLSVSNVIRNIFFVLQSWIKSKTDNPKKLTINHIGLVLLGLSISYIMMTIQNGIEL
jgi:hypothetical protein